MGGRGSSSGGSSGSGEKAVNASMPQLTGSEKQVSWAESIRSKALASADRLSENYKTLQSRAPANDKNFAEQTLGYNLKDAEVVRKEVVSAFQEVSSASKIIDARYEFSDRKIEELAQIEHRTGQVSAAQKKRKKK